MKQVIFFICLITGFKIFSMENSLELSNWNDQSDILQDLPKEKYYLNEWAKCYGYSGPLNQNIENKSSILVYVGPDIINEREKNIFIASLKQFCKKLSNFTNSRVLLIWFYSSNQCDLNSLNIESQYLYDLISYFNEHVIITLSSGVAGALVKAGSNYLHEQVIDLMIFLGTPIIELSDNRFAPNNYKKIINFYSNADFEQILQNFSIKGLITGASTSRKIGNSQETGKNYDIRTQINGNECSHGELIKVIKKLYEILQLLEHYKYHTDLELNIGFEQVPEEQLQMAIRTEKGYSIINPGTIEEINFSNDQKLIFKNIYHKEMSTKQGKIEKTFSVEFAKQALNSLSSYWSK